jgi:hypothetical protein
MFVRQPKRVAVQYWIATRQKPRGAAMIGGRAWVCPMRSTANVNGYSVPWVKVPDDIIIRDTPNAAGEPVLCHSFVNTAGNISVEGSTLFCFVPPPES